MKTREQFAAVEMDIEGAEYLLGSASRYYLRRNKNIRLTCYIDRNSGDTTEALERLFRKAG